MIIFKKPENGKPWLLGKPTHFRTPPNLEVSSGFYVFFFEAGVCRKSVGFRLFFLGRGGGNDGRTAKRTSFIFFLELIPLLLSGKLAGGLWILKRKR